MQCIDDYVLQKIHIIFKSRMRHAFRKKRRSPVEIPNAIRELLCALSRVYRIQDYFCQINDMTAKKMITLLKRNVQRLLYFNFKS